jgi:hypothetical protein
MFIQSAVKHAISVAVLISGCASFAQQAQIPFQQIQRDARLSMLAPSNADPASAPLPASAPRNSSSAAPLHPVPPASASFSAGLKRVPAGRSPRIADKKFLWLSGIHLAMAFADIAAAQHCIDEQTCKEANPLMPSSLEAKVGLNLGIFAYSTGTSYLLKKRRSGWWWALPVEGIGFHAGGVMSGITK